MTNQPLELPTTSDLRKIARGSLSRFARGNANSIKEAYLFKDDHYVGVRYSLGQFCFEWKQPELHASLTRGELLIETVSLTGEAQVGRAA